MAPLRAIFSEFGLIRYRVIAEIRWLQALSDIPEVGTTARHSEAGRCCMRPSHRQSKTKGTASSSSTAEW